MGLSLDFNLIFSRNLGKKGLAPSDLEALGPRIAQIHRHISEGRERGEFAFMELGANRDFLRRTVEVGAQFKKFENVVVLGIGGSSLGAKALFSGLGHPFHNHLPKESRPGARLFFPDNADASTFQGLMEVVELEKTVFAAITKSGGTAETWAQLLWVMKKLGVENSRKQIVAITDPQRGALREAATKFDWNSLPVPPAVGGRFSVFSPVGLFPAYLAGLDIEKLLEGASAMVARCTLPNLFENPAYLLASALYLMDTQRGRHIHVFMPYADALRDVSDWFVQLWAESLGKKHESKTNVGPTPLRAIGATDQHSLLQLLMEGPEDKCTLFVQVDKPRVDIDIPEGFTHADVSYLAGHSVHRLLLAELDATSTALANNERPSITIRMPQLDARSLGELMMLLEMATAVAGSLYGVNPFDQPGVEAGKRYACGLLGRPGYEAARDEMLSRPPKNPMWVL